MKFHKYNESMFVLSVSVHGFRLVMQVIKTNMITTK